MAKKIFQNSAKKIGEFVYRNFEKNSGSMILVTSMSAIALSCIAQTTAIFLNKKYTLSQKAFMIPQELTEGVLTVASMFLVTKPIQKFSKLLCKTGKLAPKEILDYMKSQQLLVERGNKNFDFPKNVNKIIESIKKSDKYAKLDIKEQKKLIKPHQDVLHNYDIFTDSTSAIATTVGSIFTTAFMTPLVRNYSASYYQQRNLKAYEKIPTDIKEKYQHIQFYTPIMQKAYGHDLGKMKV